VTDPCKTVSKKYVSIVRGCEKKKILVSITVVLQIKHIRMDLQGVGCGNMDWNGLAQNRDRWRTVVSAVMNLRVP
jgi:hypothetical protein